MKPIRLFLPVITPVLMFTLWACAVEETKDALLPVPYGRHPETPRQDLLDSLATLDKSLLVDSLLEIAPGRKQHFYWLNGRPYSGWVKEDFTVQNGRMRYCQIDSGLVNWQIGYFTNGNRDCDFHALNGFNHGSQRMWSEDGTPYIETYSIKDEPEGEQRLWHSNGVLDWFAVFDQGELVHEFHYSTSGRIEEFKGDISLPILTKQALDSLPLFEQKGNGMIYRYLQYYFEPTTQKQVIRVEGTDTCHFRQEFARDISIEIDVCKSIANSTKFILPKSIQEHEVKHLMTQVFPAEYGFSWSSDTLFYTEGGIPERAGCQLIFPKNDTAQVVLIQCTE